VRKDKVYTKKGVYFAFPFAMQHPQFKYALQNGYIDPAKDILPGGGREWFSVQQWVDLPEYFIEACRLMMSSIRPAYEVPWLIKQPLSQ
jgi:hypothetical protein